MKLIAATNNKGKYNEFVRILSPLGIEVLSQQQAGVEAEPEETGTTFEENATIKAMAVYRLTGLPTVADDSGLCVDALDGRPGIYSARYAGTDTNYQEKMASLLAEMQEVPQHMRTARFICHITCVLDEETILQCQASCEGIIGFEPVGNSGFGFDPLFIVQGKSYGELSAEEKDKNSHRGQALRLLVQKLLEEITYYVDK